MDKQYPAVDEITRRRVLRWGAGAAALATPLARRLAEAQTTAPNTTRGASSIRIPLRDGWTVTEKATAGIGGPFTLPHTAVALSWQDWKSNSWSKLFTYSKSFVSPLAPGSSQRVLLRFEAVMSAAKVSLNGHPLGEHLGGFLPFQFEITTLLREQNDLIVTVDGGNVNAPPSGGPNGAGQIDYLLPAGITRDVSLRIVPAIYLDDVFAKPVNVLSPDRQIQMNCTIDAATAAATPLRLRARLFDGSTAIGDVSTTARIEHAGKFDLQFALKNLQNVTLWSPDNPKLYTLKVLLGDAATGHEFVTRVGFREARFAVDGFYLNGKKARLFGLNRHELFPYTGFAMPDRVMRHDAEMLKHELNVNTVRCSHYPQTEAFLDACDELGLMVWQEVPGWQYVGDDAWCKLLVRDVHDMIVRDRNHASVIIWGVRVNESADLVPLYQQTTALAKSLDDSRPCSGSMTHRTTDKWAEDVFAYDDYHSRPDGSVAMYPAVPGVPFMNAEAVGQFAYEHGGGFKQYYRRNAARDVTENQAKYHAQGHDRGADDPRSCGVIAWLAFDYASFKNGFRAVKCPGVVDTFRIPKLGATFYQSQVSPAVKPVIAPSFDWDVSDGTGPGRKAIIFSNCDRLTVTIGSRPAKTLQPDKQGYPHLAYPPFQVDLGEKAVVGEDLVVQGFVGETAVLTRRFSLDRSKDQIALQCDDTAITNDGSDATRVWFSVCDHFGAMVTSLEGIVEVGLTGPGELVGDTKFILSDTGGVGAVWVRFKPGAKGAIEVLVRHPRYGERKVMIQASDSA